MKNILWKKYVNILSMVLLLNLLRPSPVLWFFSEISEVVFCLFVFFKDEHSKKIITYIKSQNKMKIVKRFYWIRLEIILTTTQLLLFLALLAGIKGNLFFCNNKATGFWSLTNKDQLLVLLLVLTEIPVYPLPISVFTEVHVFWDNR